MRIKGARVLITGASSGIGKATAFEFARNGAILAITSRRIDSLKQVANEIINTFPDVSTPLAFRCDVADVGAVRKLIKNCVDNFGGIDILVNNAGIGIYGETEKTPLEDFHLVMNVNFFGALHCMMEVIPIMHRAGHGVTVNIVSIAAKQGVPFLGAYCASKSALVSVSQSLRAELSGSGIQIIIVYPGYTETNFFNAEKKVGSAHRPHIRYALPETVAQAIIRAVKQEQKEVILSLEGKCLVLAQRFAPWLIDKVMVRFATQLR